MGIPEDPWELWFPACLTKVLRALDTTKLIFLETVQSILRLPLPQNSCFTRRRLSFRSAKARSEYPCALGFGLSNGMTLRSLWETVGTFALQVESAVALSLYRAAIQHTNCRLNLASSFRFFDKMQVFMGVLVALVQMTHRQ
jgi:hypothetical protein